MSGTAGAARDPQCIFCRIIAGELPCFKLLEDAHSIAFMDINPGNDGHALVVPKVHAANLYETPDAALAAAIVTAKRVGRAIQAALSPDGVSLMQANGPGAAQSVMHFHIHVLPRRNGDELTFNGLYPAGDMQSIESTAERIRARL